MTETDGLLGFCRPGGEAPLYVPDLTLWYDWHRQRDTLPEPWQGQSQPQIARALGVPPWLVARPWRIETPGVEVQTTEQDGERLVRHESASGVLTARWTLDPAGTWWQTEYPVKGEDDLPAALELARARTYVVDPAALDEPSAAIGEDGVLAVELPARPYADLLHDLLGMSEGFILLSLGLPEVSEILGVLEDKLQEFVAELAALPGGVWYSPDNLDAQFISPAVFGEHLAESYSHTVATARGHGKQLVVHTGGPIRPLLAPLAAAGVAGVQGVSGPPQGDASPSPAREAAGPDLALWGGIPQDFLLATRTEEDFEAAVAEAVHEGAGDSQLILGVADRVPTECDLSRLQAIPGLIEKAR